MFSFTRTHPAYSPYHHPQDQEYGHVARDQRSQYYQHQAAERGHRNRSQHIPDHFDPYVTDDYEGTAAYHDPYDHRHFALGAQGLNAGLRELDRMTRKLETDAEEMYYMQYEEDHERRGRSRQGDDWTFTRVRPSKSRDSTRNRRASSRPAPQTDRIHDPLPPQRPTTSRPTTPSSTMRHSVSRQSLHSPVHPQYIEYEQERYQRPRSKSRPRESHLQTTSPYVSNRDPLSRSQSRTSHRQSLHDRTHSPHPRPQLAPPSPFSGIDQLERDRRPYASPRRPSTGLDQPKRQGAQILPEIQTSELEQFDEATKTQIHTATKAIQDFNAEFARVRYEFTTPQVLDYQIAGEGSDGKPANAERGGDGVMAVLIPRELSDFHSLPASFNDQPSEASGKPKLAYTTRNVSIHAYMETLNKLLIKLDGVESWGSKGLRENRRQVVKSVEREAKKLEDWIGYVWERYQRLSPVQQQQEGQTLVRARAASESASKQREKMPSPRSQPLPSTSPGTRAAAMPTRAPGHGYAFSTCVDSDLDSDAPLTSDASPLRLPSLLDRNSAGVRLEVRGQGMTNRTKKKGTDMDMGVDMDLMDRDRLEDIMDRERERGMVDRDMAVDRGEDSRMMMVEDGQDSVEGDEFTLIERFGGRGEWIQERIYGVDLDMELVVEDTLRVPMFEEGAEGEREDLRLVGNEPHSFPLASSAVPTKSNIEWVINSTSRKGSSSASVIYQLYSAS